jgi:hypothetical protein
MPRISISFEPQTMAELERLAQTKGVSIAWVVRDAVLRLVNEHNPILQVPRIQSRIHRLKTDNANT